MTLPANSANWFSETLMLSGVAHTGPEKEGDPAFIGKRLGLLNGSSWITPWANYFGRLYLPGVHLINIANEALQINFMEAHEQGLATPPQSNIDAFARYALDLVQLGHVDAILITCSTMNRSFPAVVDAVKNYSVPVVQIDRPMMEKAVKIGGTTLVIATHGPTVASTKALLEETAIDLDTTITMTGETVESAWHYLADGDIEKHNKILAETIRSHQRTQDLRSVVLAQLSMSIFLLTFPDPVLEFGIPILCSGQCGFERMAELLKK